MTLLTSVFAAVICTILWYGSASKRELKIGILCWIYWGASMMWFVDGIFAYAKLKDAYFSQTPTQMLNDFYLGLSEVAFGLVIWLIILFIKDPKGVIREALFTKK